MNISSVTLSNFKGIKDKVTIDIKPITVFIGPNSSGKSSILHAIATLSQTIKIVNNTKPLVLDDDQASVHLGRFIDVIHTKKYTDSIGLGLNIDHAKIRKVDIKKNSKGKDEAHETIIDGPINFYMDFKCVKISQEIFINNGEFNFGNDKYAINKTKDGYALINSDVGINQNIFFTDSFLTDLSGVFNPSMKNPFQLIPFIENMNNLRTALKDIRYLGPFRQPPQRNYRTMGSNPIEVGSMGEHTVSLLSNELMQTRTRDHITQIKQWLIKLGLAKGVDVNRVTKTDMFNIDMQLFDDEVFSIANLGYGLSQILPVLTQCSYANNNSTLLFEQPEIHLHPLAAEHLSEVFVDIHKNRNVTSIIETHSDKLVSGFIRAIREKKLDLENFAFYRVNRKNKKTQFERIEIINESGDIDIYGNNWRKDFSEQI